MFVANQQAKQLLLCGNSVADAAQFENLLKDSNFSLWYSYGEEIPANLTGEFLYWGASKYLYSLWKLMPELKPLSPGSHWLSSLSEELLGRKIVCSTFKESVDFLEASDLESVRFKLAELKHGAVPPKRYTVAQLSNLLENNSDLSSVLVQWTPTELNLNFEHRFFVVDGKITAGSPYLVNGVVGGNSSADWIRYVEALDVARSYARDLRDCSPFAYSLDIGLLEDSNRWIIIEANRSWSSGIYHAELYGALDSIGASLWGESDDSDPWLWSPDEAIALYSEPLKFVNEGVAGSGLLKLS